MNYRISTEESKRIDILKTLSIIFVVYIHAYAVEVTFAGDHNILEMPRWLSTFEYLISHVISSFAVPMFFLISSVLLFKTERKYVSTLKNKVKTLLIPYLFWNTVGVVIFIVLQSVNFTAPFFSGASTPILESSIKEWMMLYGIGADCPKVYPLWFLRDLILVTVGFPIIKTIVNLIPFPMLLLGVTLVLFPGKIPFQEVISWSLIGACVVKLDLRLEKLDKIPVRECVPVYLIFTGVTLCATSPILDRINLFVGVLFWLRMSGFVYHSPKIYAGLTTLTPWVFVIYAFHEPAMSALKKLCFKILPVTSLYLFIEYLLIPIIMIVGCTIFGYILKKIVPKLYGIATGER